MSYSVRRYNPERMSMGLKHALCLIGSMDIWPHNNRGQTDSTDIFSAFYLRTTSSQILDNGEGRSGSVLANFKGIS
jgi:hypothetical protein